MVEAATPSVSLVIPARNAAETLPLCLDAVVPLLGHELIEIILVDDGSTDSTAELRHRYPLVYIRGEGRGPAAARNLGWRQATGSLIWFLDSDTVPQPQTLPLLLEEMKDDQVGAVGGSYINQVPHSFLACLIHEEIVLRHGHAIQDVNYLATFNVIYRRHILEEVGGFDERFRTAEDAELAYRIHRAGHRMRLQPASLVGHFHPTRLRPYLRTQRMHGYNRVLLYLQHRGFAKGDSYSGSLDHLQPPLAILCLATLPLLFWAWLAWIPAVLSLLLLLAQAPMTLRIVAATRSPRYLTFAPMSFLRAFWRGIGLCQGVLAWGRKTRVNQAADSANPTQSLRLAARHHAPGSPGNGD